MTLGIDMLLFLCIKIQFLVVIIMIFLFAILVYNTLISNNFVPVFEILYYFIDFTLYFVFNDFKNILFNFKTLAHYS